MKKNYEQFFKNDLLSGQSITNKADYVPTAKVFHGKHLSLDPTHMDIDDKIVKIMKKTTYSIGKKGRDAPNEVSTTNQTHLTDKLPQSEKKVSLDNPRRCDPENPNRIKTVGFGYGSEKGTYEHQVEHRAKTFYGDVFNAHKSPFLDK